MAIDNYNLSDVVLYRKIEKRGFLIMNEKGEILEWPNQIRFVGDQLTKKQLPNIAKKIQRKDNKSYESAS